MNQGYTVEESSLKRMARATLGFEKMTADPVYQRRGPRDIGGNNQSALTEDDDRRSCDEALAWNFSGETIEPMHVGWLDRDTNTLDSASDYGDYLPGGVTVVESQLYESETFTDSILEWEETEKQDDDLLLVYSFIDSQNRSSMDGTQQLHPLDQVYDENDEVDLAGIQGTPIRTYELRYLWWDEVDGTGVQLSNPGDTVTGYVILRGVKRYAPATLIESGSSNYSFYGLKVWRAQATWETDTDGVGSLLSNSRTTVTYPDNLESEYVVDFGALSYINTDNADEVTVVSETPNLWSATEEGGTLTGWYKWAANVQEGDNSGSHSVYRDPDPPYWTTAIGGDKLAETISIVFESAVESNTTAFPSGTCNPLVMTELRRVAALEADDDPSRRAATELLNKEKRRYPLPAKAAITNGDSGTVVRDGYTTVWAYRRNLTDTYLGAAPWNAMRSTSDKLGTYYYNQAAGENSGVERAENFQGRQQMLYSQAGESALEVLRWGRDRLDRDTDDITVTLTATKSSGNTAVAIGSWDNFELSTGYDEAIEGTPQWIVSTTGATTSTTRQFFDLTIDSSGIPTPGAPLYGVTGDTPDNYTVMSTNGKFTATLYLNRFLSVSPVLSYWGALADDTQETDTFVLESDAGTIAPVSVHPWYYVDPENKTYSGATYVDWPETAPAYPLVVPEGTDIEIDAAFDPYFARKLGFDEEGSAYSTSSDEYKRDQRLGLQLAFVRFKAHPYDKQCC